MEEEGDGEGMEEEGDGEGMEEEGDGEGMEEEGRGKSGIEGEEDRKGGVEPYPKSYTTTSKQQAPHHHIYIRA